MISKPLRSVAADANVLLGACLGAPTRRVFSQGGLEVVTTLYNLEEVAEYLPRLAAKRHIPLETLQALLSLLPVKAYSPHEYKDHVGSAAALGTAPDDVHLAALALKLGIPVWSNDSDFEGFPEGVFTTAQLLKVLAL